MCGICGLVALTPEATVHGDVLARMTRKLIHRGPDDVGSMLTSAVGIAVRRLSIIDLEGGHQPMANEAGDVFVVQNGEVYNFAALRSDLRSRGHHFRTECDTEVIVHLYEEKGPTFARDLRGMFAIAVWDQRLGRVVLTRDRFGIKPLLYTVADGVFAFSSEMKSLLEVPRERLVSLEALHAYLAFTWTPGNSTMLEGVHRVPPGHIVTIMQGAVTIEKYGDVTDASQTVALDGMSEGELAQELRERMRDSVRAHLVSDVPVGVLLSGGVDSSLITALAAEIAPRLKTFSIGFRDRSFNELDKARLVAQHFGTDHHELVVEPDLAILLPRLVETFDEPLGDSSLVPTFLVSELARRDVKVALAGEGGDELFGGYRSYVADSISRRWGPAMRYGRPLVERLPARHSRWIDRARRFSTGVGLPPLERHCAWQFAFSPAVVDSLLVADAASRTDPLVEQRRRYAAGAHLDWLTRLQDVDTATYLPNDLLMKSDLASMAHSLEIRVPFLDTRVSGFAYALAPHHKVRGLQKKRLLRRAARPLLPSGILNAPKQGFSIPAASWLHGELRSLVTDVLSPATVLRQGFFDPATVQRVLRAHFDRTENHASGLWGLMMFTLWADHYGVGLA
jgi:asparagine synthase (glutamine-hydrolysing)